MENVKALVSQKFMPDFRKWIDRLSELGYTSAWQILNSRDFGVPQNRERVFMVSILDPDAFYHFPKTFPLERRLKDVLENEVDEKYYLRPEQVERIVEHCDRKVAEGCGFTKDFNNGGGDIAEPLSQTTEMKQARLLKKARMNNSQDGLIVGTEGIAPTHTAGHGNTPKIYEE